MVKTGKSSSKKQNLPKKVVELIAINKLYFILALVLAILAVAYFSRGELSNINKNNQEVKAEANQALNEEDYDLAEEKYKVLINRQPEEYSHHYQLAKTYHYQKEYQEAYQVYEKAYNLDKNKTYLLNLMANCQREIGDLNQAERLYREAISKSPNSPAYYQNLATMLYSSGSKKEARQVLEGGIDNNPNSKSLKKMLRGFN